MNFPQFPYSPLRPQTTIEIENVKTTNSETQPSVKIIAILLVFFTKGHHPLSYLESSLGTRLNYPMNNIFETPQMAERLESLKTGIISGFSSGFGFLLTILYSPTSWWIGAISIGISGFLFGVTYRYIIRTDDNPQLKSGAVMAFGLVRGLAYPDKIQTTIALTAESIFCFAIAATILNFSIQKNWIKPFPESN
jgi:hypothetical protein